MKKANDILINNLKAEMKRLELDYNDLARATGLSRSGVYKMVEGITWPSADNLDRIGKALKRSSGWLMTDHESEENQITPHDAIRVLAQFVDDNTEPPEPIEDISDVTSLLDGGDGKVSRDVKDAARTIRVPRKKVGP